MADGILEVNHKIEKENLSKQHVDVNRYAMVIRNKEVAVQEAVVRYFPKLTAGRKTSRQHHDSARGLGHMEGRKINLHQVTGGPPVKVLTKKESKTYAKKNKTT